jgi:hypothetical protein
MKKLLVPVTLAAAFTASAQAQSWGVSLGNGAGFYWGKPACPPVYAAPAPVYYQRPVVVYPQPQTIYMQPYQQMRPVYAPPTVVYRCEPVVIRESRRRCGNKW